MSLKRTLLPPAFKNKKRICTRFQREQSNSSWGEEDQLDLGELPSDTKAGLLHLKNLFPIDKFEGRLPPVMMTHQLYNIVNNRTLADKELGEMRQSGEVRMFKLGTQTNEYCILFTEDYQSHVKGYTENLSINKRILDKFLTTVLSECQDICVNQAKMITDFDFKDEDITQLIKAGVLTVRDVGSWWLSFPGAGMFMKSFTRGRKAILTTIRKCKYKEILQTELESRKLPKVAKLGMIFHIHDIVGADLVDCISTTSGTLLRLKDS